MSGGSILGNRVLRSEDRRFLTGGGEYVAGVALQGSLHVVFVRSIMAHAVLGSIDTTHALSMPGVAAVVTGDQLGSLWVAPAVRVDDSARRRILPTDRVRFVGEAIVAVVATTRSQATDAAEAVVIDYEPLRAVVGVDAALRDETVLFETIGSNVVTSIEPPPAEIDFATCEVVIERQIVNQRVAPVPLEPRVGAADWAADGHLTVWASCQGAGAVRQQINAVYGTTDAEVRVIAPDIGGGFGAKASASCEELALPGLSRLVGRPVRWAETRSENLVAMVHGRGQNQHIKMGGTRDGRVTHYALHVVQDTGAYVDTAAVLPWLTLMMLTGTYAIENAQFSSQTVVTNTTPVGAFRGAGRPEAAAAIERAIDLFAAEIGMDPAEVRRANVIAAFDEPHVTPLGTSYDVGDYPKALTAVLAASDYPSLRSEQQRRRATNASTLLGIGLSSYVEVTAIGGPDGSSEYGRVQLRDDGTILALTGSTPQGQGHETTWAMVISNELNIGLADIEVVFGDTDLIPGTSITGGSRSAQIAGTAMLDASAKLIEAARTIAATLLEASIDDIVFSLAAGEFHVVGTPAVSVSWPEIAKASSTPLFGLSDFVQAQSTFPFGAHCAVVEVDPETGAVELLRHIAVDDCGTILNPLLVDGQVHGGLAAGAAQALLEAVCYDPGGTPLTSNFADYAIISAPDLPSFERVEMVTPTPLNPLGAKGIGESATIGSTPAVQNAVVDALSHLGVRHIDMPCTPETVWRAIVDAGGYDHGLG